MKDMLRGCLFGICSSCRVKLFTSVDPVLLPESIEDTTNHPQALFCEMMAMMNLNSFLSDVTYNSLSQLWLLSMINVTEDGCPLGPMLSDSHLRFGWNPSPRCHWELKANNFNLANSWEREREREETIKRN